MLLRSRSDKQLCLSDRLSQFSMTGTRIAYDMHTIHSHRNMRRLCRPQLLTRLESNTRTIACLIHSTYIYNPTSPTCTTQSPNTASICALSPCSCCSVDIMTVGSWYISNSVRRNHAVN